MALKISFKAEARTDKNGEGVTHKLYIYDPVHGGYDIDPESWEFHTSETSAAYFRKALEPSHYRHPPVSFQRFHRASSSACSCTCMIGSASLIVFTVSILFFTPLRNQPIRP